jgi:hypothetical protein
MAKKVLREPERALGVLRSSRGTSIAFTFLRREWCVTAKHALAEGLETVTLEFAGARPRSARVALRHPRFDLAVVELHEPAPGREPLQPADDAPDSGLVCLSLISDGAREGASVRNRVETFERTRRRRDYGEETLFMFPAPPGEPVRSGSPLVTLDARVVAVVTDGICLDGIDYLRATAIAPLLGPLQSLARAPRP